jgi:DNA-binding MarR family transcriptional regulator
MPATTTHSVDDIARELLGVVTHVFLAALRGRRRANDLKEVEFLTLSLLQAHGTMIVGDIQRQLGVLPAQMSRIIRSLENRERPLISCHINSQDKRKIDVSLTGAGEQALANYQEARVGRLVELLRNLPDDDQEHLQRLLETLNRILDQSQS